jgi:hypothetical protein
MIRDRNSKEQITNGGMGGGLVAVNEHTVLVCYAYIIGIFWFSGTGV